MFHFFKSHKALPEIWACLPKPNRLLLFPCGLSMLAGFFEAVNIGYLMPLTQGLFARDIRSVLQTKPLQILEKIIHFQEWSTPKLFIFLLAVIFASAILKNIAEYLSGLLMSRYTIGFSNNLRKLLFGRFLIFGKSFYDKTNIGINHQTIMGFTSRVSYDLRDVQLALNWLIQLTVYVSAMFYISWQLALFTLTIFPILNYALNFLVHKIRVSSQAYAEAITALSKKTHNILSSIVLVKTHSQQAYEAGEFSSMSDVASANEFSIEKKRALVGPLQEIILIFMVLILVGVMAVLMTHEKGRSASVFIIFLYLLKRASNNFKAINGVKVSLASSSGVWKSIFSLLDNTDKHIVRHGDKKISSFEDKIEIKDLSFSYDGQRQILRHLNFTIKKGQMTALVGATGAGKSTLIQLIARYYEAPDSSILVDGTDINRFDPESFYEKLAIVNQDIELMNDTIRFNVLYGLKRSVSAGELQSVIENARLSEFIASLPKGLDSHVGDRGVRLSGGERQRLSIARALLKNPELLILDEATSALDSKTEREIQEAIDFLVKGKTSIVIAHRLSTIKHADQIVVLDQGQIMESGSLQELLEKKGKFFEFWQAQKFG